MTCREFIEFLLEYLSETLPQAERVRFDEHLTKCPHCVAYLKSYEETVRLGQAVFTQPDDPVPTEVPEDLVQAILATRATKP
jgi:anti-sigma factor RsiW